MLIVGTPWKKILKFALPLMLANILQQLYNTVDTIVVGNFSSQNALAAVGSFMYIAGLYTGICIALSLGVGVLVSQSFGAKDYEKLKKTSCTGLILVLIAGFLISLFSFFTSGMILKHVISVPQEIYNQALIYAKIYSVGLFFQFGFNVFASIIRALGDSKSTFYFLLVTTIVNIVLDLFFVLNLKLGVMGVGIATLISQLLAMTISYFYMIIKYPLLKPHYVFDKKLSNEILKTGIPLTMQAFIVNGGFMIMQSIANSYGVQMTASYAVSCRLEIYMLVPIISILHAMSTYAGQNFGAGNIKRLFVGVKQAVIMNIIIALIIGGICFVFAPNLIALFGIKNQAYNYALSHTRLASVDLLLYAIYSPVNGLCIGIGKGYVLSVVSLVEFIGRIGFALYLSGIIGASCVWWCEPFAWIIVVIGVYVFYFLKIIKVLNKDLTKSIQ